MWDPADKRALPTPNDLLEARKAILILEEQLAQAERRVCQIRRELEERRAWIASIRRINFDILSIIFELCGEVDWKAPLRLSAASSNWRNTALATPRAWSFIDLRKDVKVDCIRLFFERSGQRLLHIGFSSKMRHDEVQTEVARKIQCLSIGQFFFGTPLSRIFAPTNKTCFPYLTRLRVRRGRAGVQLSDLSAYAFPYLRHLGMAGSLDDEYGSPSISTPALQTLKLSAGDNDLLIRLLEGCKKTLVSVSIKFQRFLLPGPRKIELPHLQCLEVINLVNEEHPHQLILKTPSLATYIGVNESGSVEKYLQVDVEAITRMRLDLIPVLSSVPYLRVLQIENFPVDYLQLFEQLDSTSQNCPLLKSIELRALGIVPFSPDDIEAIECINQQTRLQGVHLVTTNRWSTDLPGFITNLCGENMSCISKNARVS